MRIPRERLCLYSSPVSGHSCAREIITIAAELGITGVELMNFCDELGTPDIKVAKEIGALARKKGLSLPCFSVGIDIIPDPVEKMKMLRGYAKICSELEIPYLHHTIALDYKCGRLDDAERERRFNTGAACALELADFCAPLGVRTLIEEQGFVFNGAAACNRLIEMSGERIGIVADVGNILFADEDPADFIRAMKGRVCHAHVKDYSLSPVGFGYKTAEGRMIYDCEIGTGCIDLDGVGRAFRDIGYTGMYALEFAAPKDMDEVRRVISRLCD